MDRDSVAQTRSGRGVYALGTPPFIGFPWTDTEANPNLGAQTPAPKIDLDAQIHIEPRKAPP